jgi:hypothetical protein
LSQINFISLSVLAMIIYFTLLYVFKTFSEEDIAFIRNCLRKKTA